MAVTWAFRHLKKELKIGSNAPYEVHFSRNIKDQQLQYWMIIVKYHKLELSLTPEGDYQLNYSYDRRWTPERESTSVARKATIGRTGNGYDGWVLVDIGQTRVSDKEIDDIAWSARDRYEAPERLTWMECQEFLGRLADLIITFPHPQFNRFFNEHTDIRRRDVTQLPPVQSLGPPCSDHTVHNAPPGYGAICPDPGAHYRPRPNTMPNVQLLSMTIASMANSQNMVVYGNGGPGIS